MIGVYKDYIIYNLRYKYFISLHFSHIMGMIKHNINIIKIKLNKMNLLSRSMIIFHQLFFFIYLKF